DEEEVALARGAQDGCAGDFEGEEGATGEEEVDEQPAWSVREGRVAEVGEDADDELDGNLEAANEGGDAEDHGVGCWGRLAGRGKLAVAEEADEGGGDPAHGPEEVG